MPLITPAKLTEAIDGLPLLQTPPVVVSLSVVVLPAHTVVVPVICAKGSFLNIDNVLGPLTTTSSGFPSPSMSLIATAGGAAVGTEKLMAAASELDVIEPVAAVLRN